MWKIFYKIFKYSMQTLNFMRIVIINIFFLILVIAGIMIYLNLNHSTALTTPTVLILDLVGTITDKPATQHNKIRKFENNFFNTHKSYMQENSLFDIVNALRQAKNDPNITGLILSLKNFSGSNQASLEYIGKILCEFKQSGKPIYAISDYYNQPQYLLASYANKIYLTQQGSIDLRGISTNRLYYKSFLDNLKINTYIFRVGEYKSAVEPFTRNNMSDYVRKSEKIWVDKLWKQYLKIISTNRNTTIQQIFPEINNIIKNLHLVQGDTAKYALQNKWIDKVAPYNTIENEMKQIFGSNTHNTSINSISIYDYNLITSSIKQNNQIAVICINGIIVDGSNTSNCIGSDTIINKIRDARFNPKIKAIILRINSPGGSANASDLIRSELIATYQNSKKPIIVSMSGIAASGGYWISTPANFIVASNSTLTGSIGVFGIINTFEDSLNKIGIYNDGVDTSPIANISITKNLSNEYIHMMQLYVNASYHHFVKTVAESRHTTFEKINKIAQGYVWIGYDAVKNGLIDKIGDFDDAINKAAELANLKLYKLKWYEDHISWIDLLLKHTEKIIHSLFIKKINHNILFSNIHNLILTNNVNMPQCLWNDPKHCYTLFYN